MSARNKPANLLAVAGLATLMAIFATTAAAQDRDNGSLSGEALVGALKQGGYNLYVRHAATDWSQSDKIRKEGDWTSCESQKVRQLSDKGRADAGAAGKAIKALGIPLGQISSSPYCRTVETARLMGTGDVETTHDLMNLRSADYVGGRAAVTKRARARLAERPAAGKNNLFVAHGNLALAATGLTPGEGEALIFEPLGDGNFKLVGRLTPAQWVELADRS